jgi:signal transduction histidine kinase
LLLDLARQITASLDLQEVLDTSFHALRQLVPFGGGAIQLIEDGMLVPVATDPPLSAEARTVRIPIGQGISGTIAQTGEPIYIPDIWSDERVHATRRARGVSHNVRSYFGLPLIMHGHPIGVVQIDSPLCDAFDAAMRARVLTFAPAIASAVQNAVLYQREADTIQRLQESERIKRDFLAVVSHELRTPLTSVAGFGYTLAAHADRLDAETVADIGQRIWRAGRRLERVMGDLLDLSQIERGTLPTAVVPTPVEPIIEEAVAEQNAGTHTFDVRIEPDLPHVFANPQRLHQVFGNLLSNARKFSPPGTTIHIHAFGDADRVAVAIGDRGRGIPPEMLDRIFDRFFQVEPAETRSADGLGIGLYLVKQFCDRMGATVGARSGPEAGTTVTVRLRTP